MVQSQFATNDSDEKQYFSPYPTIFALPAEIRLKIYEKFYKDVVVGVPRFRQDVCKTWNLARDGEEHPLSDVSNLERNIFALDYKSSMAPFGLLHVCGTTRTESVLVFHRTVFSHIGNPMHSYQARNSLRLLGYPGAKSTRSVIFHVKEALAFYRTLSEGNYFFTKFKNRCGEG
jgi:hypothetical protein